MSLEFRTQEYRVGNCVAVPEFCRVILSAAEGSAFQGKTAERFHRVLFQAYSLVLRALLAFASGNAQSKHLGRLHRSFLAVVSHNGGDINRRISSVTATSSGPAL